MFMIRMFKVKKVLLVMLLLIFIACLVIFSGKTIEAANNGIRLWLNIVFPSLFPFLVASSLLSKSGIIKKLGKLLEPVMRPFFNVPGCGSFPLAMGITSGYPVGAKLTAELREENYISKEEAERLLTFTNNSGPLFIIGAVAVGMFRNHKLGFLLLASHILAGITVGMIFKHYKGEKKNNGSVMNKVKQWNAKKPGTENFGKILGEAVKNAVTTLLQIGGYIIFFSVLICLLNETGIISGLTWIFYRLLNCYGIDKSIIESILNGFFEITAGTSLAGSSGSGLIQRATAAAFILGWAGLSVHSQVAGIISSTDISLRPYLKGKFLQGVIAAVYTYIMLKLFYPVFNNEMPVFYESGFMDAFSLQEVFVTSLMYLGFSLMILLVSSLAGKMLIKKIQSGQKAAKKA